MTEYGYVPPSFAEPAPDGRYLTLFGDGRLTRPCVVMVDAQRFAGYWVAVVRDTGPTRWRLLGIASCQAGAKALADAELVNIPTSSDVHVVPIQGAQVVGTA